MMLCCILYYEFTAFHLAVLLDRAQKLLLSNFILKTVVKQAYLVKNSLVRETKNGITV